jgi:hypothetical protein
MFEFHQRNCIVWVVGSEYWRVCSLISSSKYETIKHSSIHRFVFQLTRWVFIGKLECQTASSWKQCHLISRKHLNRLLYNLELSLGCLLRSCFTSASYLARRKIDLVLNEGLKCRVTLVSWRLGWKPIKGFMCFWRRWSLLFSNHQIEFSDEIKVVAVQVTAKSKHQNSNDAQCNGTRFWLIRRKNGRVKFDRRREFPSFKFRLKLSFCFKNLQDVHLKRVRTWHLFSFREIKSSYSGENARLP